MENRTRATTLAASDTRPLTQRYARSKSRFSPSPIRPKRQGARLSGNNQIQKQQSTRITPAQAAVTGITTKKQLSLTTLSQDKENSGLNVTQQASKEISRQSKAQTTKILNPEQQTIESPFEGPGALGQQKSSSEVFNSGQAQQVENNCHDIQKSLFSANQQQKRGGLRTPVLPTSQAQKRSDLQRLTTPQNRSDPTIQYLKNEQNDYQTPVSVRKRELKNQEKITSSIRRTTVTQAPHESPLTSNAPTQSPLTLFRTGQLLPHADVGNQADNLQRKEYSQQRSREECEEQRSAPPDQNSQSESHGSAPSYGKDGQKSKAEGRWSKLEHNLFLEGIELFGKDWRAIEQHIVTRSCSQIRSHAQKYFLKLDKEGKKPAKLPGSPLSPPAKNEASEQKEVCQFQPGKKSLPTISAPEPAPTSIFEMDRKQQAELFQFELEESRQTRNTICEQFLQQKIGLHELCMKLDQHGGQTVKVQEMASQFEFRDMASYLDQETFMTRLILKRVIEQLRTPCQPQQIQMPLLQERAFPVLGARLPH